MKVAMIGAGGMAHRHADVLSKHTDVQVVGVVSASPARAAVAAEEWGARPYPDLDSLLDSERVEAAWICIPPSAHGPPEEALCRRSIPFFVEKPLAVDRATAERIATTVTRAGILAAVGYHWRAMDTIPEVRDTLAARPPRMVSGSWLSSLPAPAWWRRRADSGGQIIEQATHLFDLARILVGEGRVEAAVRSMGPHPSDPGTDVAAVTAALLRFTGDAGTGEISAVFTAASLVPASTTVHLQIVCDGLLVTISRRNVTYEEEAGRRVVEVENDPFDAEDRAFLDAVRRGDPSLLFCDYTDALRTHRLCCDVEDAAG